MNTLLIFFALPLAVIIISIALQKILKNPLLVASVIFAIFLIVTFIINNLNFLVATIVYTIISFITALIVCLICKFIERYSNNFINNNTINQNSISCCSSSENNNNSCNSVATTNGVSARINVIPNNNTNGNSGCICGSYRRR